MPFKYTPDQHAAAMVALERNGGNIPLTAQQFGIAENTLYAWQRNIQVFFQQNPLPAQQTAEVPAFESDLDALAFIRQNILGELSRLSASLQYDSGFSTPYQRALVMSQLMDKLLKLDLHLKPYTLREAQKIRIEFVDEQGNVHDEMPQSDDPVDYEYRPVIDSAGDPQMMSDNLWHGDADADADNRNVP